MMPPNKERARWLGGLILTAVVLAVVGRQIGQRWFPEIDYTLFVHTADAGRDPARIVASVHASRASAWSEHRDRLGTAEKLLWMEKVGGAESQRLFGSHAIRDSELTFTPASPLAPGSVYHIVFVPPGQGEHSSFKSRTGFDSVSGKGRLEVIYLFPEATKVAAPLVKSVHPSWDALPANHLKFYITFSSPMEQGVFMERIKLLRGDGSEIAGPFRETELWSPDQKRLTIWLHPGRQKTGVNLNESEGAVLRENESVTLIISGEWRAAAGQKIGADLKRTFRVGKADHEQVDPARWIVRAPKSGTRKPLRIDFPEPLDWALLQNSLSVVAAAEGATEGQIEIADGERVWRFTPNKPWNAGEHRIKVSAVLEDLAGNNLERPFEVDALNAGPQPSNGNADIVFRVE